MACDFCTNTFNGYQPLLVTILRSGSNVLLYAGNQSRNIISISRMLLCLRSPSFTVILYLRPDFPFGSIGSGKIEQGTNALVYQVNSSAASAQAEAEYVESDGRSVSCTYEL